jgi:hypothetical protein
MTDWLWVIGEAALTYGFYRYYKSNQTFVANLEVEISRFEKIK